MKDIPNKETLNETITKDNQTKHLVFSSESKRDLLSQEDDFEIINRLDREEHIKKTRRRKRTLRNFAVIFFVVLIILTFFSNTIMNYSLPEVTTTTVFSGNVSQKIRCQGSVEISSDMEVTVSGKRTVKEVLVEDGDQVKEGDVIMTFEETENEDLKEAEKTLEDLELSYEKSQLRASTDYTDDEVSIQNAKDALADAEADLDQAKADEASLATAKTEQADAQEAYDKKNAEVEGLQAQVDSYQNLEGYTGDVDVDALIAQLATAKSELASLEATLNEKNDLVTELSGKTTVEAAEDAVTEKSQSLDSLQRGLSKKKESDNITAQTNALDDADAVKKIEEQKAKIEKLKEADDCKEIKANGTGIVTGITVKAGDTVDTDSPIA
ncbi:MAG: HlyD family secretion protein, partial [Eubacterium sp.]|nr:HlyD family secretion protein [Eubacterium sp.]